jgi:hypothetical protein
MSITAGTRRAVRQLAQFAGEFCGVSETDTGGELTVDHFHPTARGGNDEPDNLLYCCHRCNQYKADYWPTQPHDPMLWQPRREPRETHLLLLANGTLYPITATGAFTLQRLPLNRLPLVTYRLRQQSHTEEHRLLARYRELIMVLEQLSQQQIALLEEQRALLHEQRTLLRLLVQRRG